MSKTLLWIDDSIAMIMEVVQGAIVDSWKLGEENEEGMKTKILIWGDACQERDSTALWKQEEENKMNRKLHELFKDECENVEGPTIGNETAEKNLHLIDRAIQILFKEEDTEEDRNLYDATRKIWKEELDNERELKKEEGEKAEENELQKSNYEQAKNYVTKIIERMDIKKTEGDGANSKEETIIGIDLELLSGDLERTRDGKRIISMEFYHQLREKKYPCFIYSSNADDNQLMKSWKDTYKVLYKDENPILTYERSNFNKKSRENMIAQIVNASEESN